MEKLNFIYKNTHFLKKLAFFHTAIGWFDEWQKTVSKDQGSGSAFVFFADPDPAAFLMRVRIWIQFKQIC